MTVYNGFDQVVGTATTGANGQYNVGQPGHRRVVGMAQANSIFLLAGSSAPAIDAELAPD